VKIIERILNKLTLVISEFEALNTMKLRSNVSFISSYKQYELDEMDSLSHVHTFFKNIVFNVGYSGLTDNLPDAINTSNVLYKNPAMFEFTKNLIISCDTGVKDIDIKRSKDEATGKDIYTPYFIHEADGQDHSLLYFQESSGTQSLYKQLGRYQDILQTGGLLCLDEFDINLHPHILPKLLELFEDKISNPNGAQLLFTSHNTEVMEYMGKYRVYLVEKEDNECFAYRLDEIPSDIIRNDRSILPLYNKGKLGGVPII
jgi:AAA15 family ATPase/GTPase